MDWLTCIVVFLTLQASQTTLSKKDKKKKASKETISPAQPDSSLTVLERGLVTETIKSTEIIKNHKLYSTAHSTTRQLDPSTISLGYVTPVCYIRSNPLLYSDF